MSKQSDDFSIEKYRIISTKTLADSFVKGQKNGERFCFILGSGASFKSGIKIGTQLEKDWLDEMSKSPGLAEVSKRVADMKESGVLDDSFDFENDILPKWKNGQKLDSKYYFGIYTLRFFPNYRNGYFYFEKMISKAKPSFGYNALAQILSDGKGSNLVITTNFDSLVEDALFIYTDKKPLVINHELLADFAENPNIKQPIIAKVHRGLFFDPLNRKEETDKLKGNWSEVLKSIFRVYTPVVIGYGGGDGSLMDLLEDEDVKMKNGIYWCYLEGSGLPDVRIQMLVKDKGGWFVKSAGFDKIMLTLGNALVPGKIEPPIVGTYLKKQYEDRVSGYEMQYRELTKDTLGKDKSAVKEQNSDSEKEFRTEFLELDSRVEQIEKSKSEKELTAEDYFRIGNRAHDEKDYDKAISDYSKAIELNPNFVEAYSNRGVAFAYKKDYDKAILDYSKAIELNPEYAKAYSNRGNAFAYKKDYDKAISDYNKAIELNPEDAEAYNNRGNAFANQIDYDKAISDYNKAIELNPEDAEAYYNRGTTFADQKDYDKAISDYSKAIELNPEDVEFYYNRGNAFADQKDYDKAISDYSKAIEMNPEDAEFYYNRGNAFADQKDYDKAISDYNKAIELKPDDSRLYDNRGFARIYIKDFDNAKKDIDKALALDPEDGCIYDSLGVLQLVTGKAEEAVVSFTRAIELGCKEADTYKNRSIAYTALNETEKAAADIARAEELRKQE